MIELYHCIGARSFRALFLLEELGLPYKLKILPYPPSKSLDLVSQNPMLTVPLLLDGDVRMTESVAICMYLSSTYSDGALGVALDEAGYYLWLEQIVFAEAVLTSAISTMLHYGGTYEFDPFMGNAKQIDFVVDYHRDKFERGVGRLAEHLRDNEFAAGQRFTAADVAIGYNFHLAELIGMRELMDPIASYRDKIVGRPAYQRAIAAELATG